MDIDDNQQDNNKGTVDAGMMLNYNIRAQKYADTDTEEETDNSSKVYTVKDSKSIYSLYLTEEEQQQQNCDNRMEIFECSTHVQYVYFIIILF